MFFKHSNQNIPLSIIRPTFSFQKPNSVQEGSSVALRIFQLILQ